MSDDLFSRLFDLFNQPGPVNWKLAQEVARHLVGDREAVDPWTADQLRELVRVAEFAIEPQAPFPVAPASDVLVLDARQWVEAALPALSYIGEAIADRAGGKTPGLVIPGLGATLAGLQVGTLAGSIATTFPASFEAGIPAQTTGHLSVIAAGVDRVVADSGAEPRDIGLWVGASEVAHRALFSVPWVPDQLAALIGALTATMVPDPDTIMGMIGSDPTSLQKMMLDPSSAESPIRRGNSSEEETALEAFAAITSGYRHFLVQRAVGHLLPALDSYHSPDPDQPLSLGWPFVEHERVLAGAEFCRDIERRFGREAIDSIWQGPERLPTSGELEDPVGWAARVLLGDGTGFDL